MLKSMTMSNTATSHTVDNSYAIDWVEKIVDQMRHDIYAGLAEIASGKVKIPRYKIDRNAYPQTRIDDRIELSDNRKEILERCLLMLADGREPVLSEDDVAFFLQMNFKGFGDEPDERVKFEYNMKPTHLIYFFRLVVNEVYGNEVTDEKIRRFRDAVVNSFVGYDLVKPETIVTYFNKVRPAVIRVYGNDMKRISAEYR
jgi:hypothetical protein